MKMDSEQVLDSIFLSYNKILKRFQLLGVTTKYGKEITHEDLRKAIEVTRKEMTDAAHRMEFEKAALLRDKIIELEKSLNEQSKKHV